jgi:hypothetical protein
MPTGAAPQRAPISAARLARGLIIVLGGLAVLLFVPAGSTGSRPG